MLKGTNVLDFVTWQLREGEKLILLSVRSSQKSLECYKHSMRKKASSLVFRRNSTMLGYDRHSHISLYVLLHSIFLLTSFKGLIKSTFRPEQQEGVRLLTEIFRASPDRRRECLYYLALGNYKLGSYAEARKYNDLLIEIEPENLQASSLKGLIDEKVQREGLVGAAIVGGIAVVAGVVGGLAFRGARGRR